MNGVRRVDGVDVDNIDHYDGTKQSGNILVTCKDGKFQPDIFGGQKLWCSGGFKLEEISFILKMSSTSSVFLRLSNSH